MHVRIALVLLSVSMGVAACTDEAAAQSVPSQITLVVGNAPGAAYDNIGRLVARHLGRHLPGEPRFVVQNMPGAGGLVAVNHTFNLAPKDGSFIALVARGYGVQPLLDKAGVMYDPLKLSWLGSVSSEVSLLWSWHTTPFKTVEDLRQREMVVLGMSVAGDGVFLPTVVDGVLGTRLKIVSGFQGNNDALIAVERGEGQGAVSSISTLRGSRPHWLSEKRINMILQLATKASPEFPDVPLVMTFAQSDAQRRVLELVFSRQDMAFPFIAPPGLPPPVLEALRRGFDATVADATFKQEGRQIGITGEPMTGEAIVELLARIYQTPEEVVNRTREIVRR
jgi:tripartite-type tricarboxylate transporter receptor subunit TctC